MATALLFGALMGFLTSSQQIYVEHFGMGASVPAVLCGGRHRLGAGWLHQFAAVTRFGMKTLSHWALGIFTSLASLALLALGLMQALPVFVFFRHNVRDLCQLQFHHVELQRTGHGAAG